LPAGRVTNKALYGTSKNYGEGKNPQEATAYVRDSWSPTDEKDLDIITVSAKAAQALVVSVSTTTGNGGYSITCRDSEIRHNKGGDLMPCHPGMINPGGDPLIVQADNTTTEYCPHILCVTSWN
jgi:hypothetical protein